MTFFDACKLTESAAIIQWVYLNWNTSRGQLVQDQIWSEQRNIKHYRNKLSGKVNYIQLINMAGKLFNGIERGTVSNDQ